MADDTDELRRRNCHRHTKHPLEVLPLDIRPVQLPAKGEGGVAHPLLQEDDHIPLEKMRIEARDEHAYIGDDIRLAFNRLEHDAGFLVTSFLGRAVVLLIDPRESIFAALKQGTAADRLGLRFPRWCLFKFDVSVNVGHIEWIPVS